jgi:Spx/MgsR family transcriptional regulator
MKIYGIKNCGSVQKAFKFFNEHNIEYEFIDLKKIDITLNEIEHWLKSLPISKLLNTKGTKYKTLKLKDKNLNDDDIKDWMCKENLIIKRPIIEYHNSKTLVAFDEEFYIKEFL